MRTASASMTLDQPRNSNEIPTDRPKNQSPDQGQSAQSRIPSRSVIVPSKTAQPQLGNFVFKVEGQQSCCHMFLLSVKYPTPRGRGGTFVAALSS